MDTTTDPRLQMGGNNPPEPLLVEAAERIETANKWLSERKEITDAETADKLSFFISQADATWKALNEQRLQEGRDFDAAQKKKYTPLPLLLLAKEKLVPIRSAWLKKEQDRLETERAAAQKVIDDARKAAEEAVQKAVEEAAKDKGGNVLEAEMAAEEAKARISEAEKAAEAVPERAHIKGAYTTKAVGLKDYWSAEVTDLSAAFKHYNSKKNPRREALNDAIREAIQDFANKDAKALKDVTLAPPGVTFKMEKK